MIPFLGQYIAVVVTRTTRGRPEGQSRGIQLSITNSRQFIKAIKENPGDFFLIHYSCQNLNDDNEGLSPRITSIATNHYATGQSISFSTHSIAEEMRISRDQVFDRLDEIELELLKRFYEFVRNNHHKHWVHWNMRNLTFGFEHLEHRYRVLGGTYANEIRVEQRLNLNDLLTDRYGSDYAKHPKMLSLMELNGGRHRDFLEGKEEVSAFKNKEFLRMHNSTLSKIGFFSSVMNKMTNGKLKTASRGFGITLDRLFESRAAKAVGFLGTTGGLFMITWDLFNLMFH